MNLILCKPSKVDSKIWDLVLNRADKLNAFSREMLSEFIQTLKVLKKEISKHNCRALVISSAAAPKAFCAGADLTERLKMSDKDVASTLLSLRKVMDGVASLACPTLAVIEGIAFGGGLELCLASDLRIASPSSSLGLTETRLAIIPGAGGTQRLSRIVGVARAKELIFLGRRLNAEEASKIGLVNSVDQNPLEAAYNLAAEIIKGGPIALQSAKRAIDDGYDLDLKRALDWERACYQKVLKSKDRVEGLKAFVEKRRPEYQGK